jgi:hypothetical protein
MSKPIFYKLVKTEKTVKTEVVETPDEWWYRIYFAVIVVTILVILALWSFSVYFSV